MSDSFYSVGHFFYIFIGVFKLLCIVWRLFFGIKILRKKTANRLLHLQKSVEHDFRKLCKPLHAIK